MYIKSRNPVKFESPIKATAIACGHVKSENRNIPFFSDVEELDK